ncbi:MAG: GGDEF domain-containing protein [Thermoleophilaceae bacterium]
MIERLVIRMPLWGWVALAALAAMALASGVFAVRERQRSRTAERNALRDPLTGVGNRLAFDHQLAIAWERAKRYDEGLGVLVLDLDGFKRVNDVGGHLAGDNVLRKVGKVIASRSRRSDVAARLGGDEFALLTSGPGVSGLSTLAKDLRASLKESGIDASLGSATRGPHDGDSAMVLHRADLAMYEDKAARKEAAEGAEPSAGARSPEVDLAQR